MNETYFLYRNARLIDPDARRIEGCDILGVRRERGSEILRIGKNLRTGGIDGLTVTNLHGGFVCAPFTDLRARIPEPGYPYRENYRSGLDAAGAGGFGRVLLMPVTKPVYDSKNALTAAARLAASSGFCRADFALPLTKGGKGAEPVNFSELRAAGARAVCGDFEEKEPTAASLLAAARACAELDMPLIAPCRKKSVGGCVNAGRLSSYFSVPGVDPIGEILAAADAITFSRQTGCALHFPLVTLKKTVELIAEAKGRGVKITCATAAPYFSLVEDELLLSGSRAKLDPPLRREEDRVAVIEGLQDGTIDCIVSDHTPLSDGEKSGALAGALPGAVGFETTFAAGVTYLVCPCHLSLCRLIELLAIAPARILGYDAEVRPGQPLDLVFPDTEAEWLYSSNTLRSRSSNTPFLGMALRGRIRSVCIDGVRKDYG